MLTLYGRLIETTPTHYLFLCAARPRPDDCGWGAPRHFPRDRCQRTAGRYGLDALRMPGQVYQTVIDKPAAQQNKPPSSARYFLPGPTETKAGYCAG